MYIEKIFKLNKQFYEYKIDKILLKENFFITKFKIKKKLILIINSTPLTRNNCIENFYFKQNKLFFKNYPILSDLCFFEIQLLNEKNLISSSQIKILFINSSNIQPKFSSKIYYFYTNNIRVFAKCSNTIRYKLQTNSYGLFINQTNGIISFNYDLDRMKKFYQIQLLVYAIDEKTYLNDTALIYIIFNKQKQFDIPIEISLCPNTPISISDRTLSGTIIQNIDYNNNNSNHYYILSGNKYNLFSINNLGQLYLISSMLNRTSEEYFELVIMISSSSSSSISYCRTNISIIRSPNWSYFNCPIIPIEWMIEEESPIGTKIGNIKEILLMINNNSELIEQIKMKLNNNNNNNNDDVKVFHFNSSTGIFISKYRLDYEQKHFYSFSIILEPNELHCTLSIIIKLI
ncbi:unnamed protein product, partial [Rotaria sordida]